LRPEPLFARFSFVVEPPRQINQDTVINRTALRPNTGEPPKLLGFSAKFPCMFHSRAPSCELEDAVGDMTVI
jgi:hypothetical protein